MIEQADSSLRWMGIDPSHGGSTTVLSLLRRNGTCVATRLLELELSDPDLFLKTLSALRAEDGLRILRRL